MSKARSSVSAAASALEADASASHPTELELKLAVQRAELPLLRQRLDALCTPAASAQVLDSRYYDTADRLLARHRMALRLRRVGRKAVQTLKTKDHSAAMSRRGEWELPAPGGKLRLEGFMDTPLAELLAGQPQLPLKLAYRTRFTRHLWHSAEGDIEIALDDGEISAGRRRQPLLELELESKGAPQDALWSLAAQLQQPQPDAAPALALLPLGESKAERGERLARRAPAKPVKGNAQALYGGLSPQSSGDAALRQVMARGIDVVLANVHGLLAREDPEFVHQARVALRRMRSAERVLRKWTRFPSRLRDELRWAAQALGRARDADVFALETLPRLRKGLDADTRQRLLDAAHTRCTGARAELIGQMQGARFAALALAVSRWAAEPAVDAKPMAAVAARRLQRAWERLREAAQFFGALNVDEQHRVRILAKRLRYALDLFAAGLPRSQAEAWGDALAALQDTLGEMNDLATAERVLDELGITQPANWRRRRSARREALARAVEQQLLQLLRLRAAWD